MTNQGSQALIRASRALAKAVDTLEFADPVRYVYNPLDYAREPFERYLSKYGGEKKRVLFLGMNPGPWGMAQTGVPFGEIDSVANWMGITGEVGAPPSEHEKRRIAGFDCVRSEVSGKRLWGLMRDRFGTPEAFFADHFVSNYCPLIFIEESGRNRTPDKLPKIERDALCLHCDDHLRRTIEIIDPEWLVGIGAYAEKRLRLVSHSPRIASILHPSPANPAANRGWAEAATSQLIDLGVWSEKDLE